MFSRDKFFSKLIVLKNIQAYFQSTGDSVKLYSNIFFDKNVQDLLKKLTNPTSEKVFKPKPQGLMFKPMEYVFMTPQQYEDLVSEKQKMINWLISPPPLIQPRHDEVQILQSNESLDGHDIDHAKFIFTDISDGTFNEIRTIVVREPNGDLRKASRSERHRMNQIYSPVPGRSYEMPKMFEDEYFNNLLNREEYEFILNKACIEFDPDDPMYHKIIKCTYEKINDKFHFEKLHSTRHFGSLAYFLICNKNIDNMLIDNIRSERIENAFDLVKLYQIIHPDCESAKNSSKEKSDLVECFIQFDSKKKDDLESLYQSLKSKHKEKIESKEQDEEAHGL